MFSSSGKKHPREINDLNGSSLPRRSAKTPRIDEGTAGGLRRDQLRAEGSSQTQPPQSQGSQFRHEEDGGNELIDDIDAYYGDDIDCMFDIYGNTKTTPQCGVKLTF